MKKIILMLAVMLFASAVSAQVAPSVQNLAGAKKAVVESQQPDNNIELIKLEKLISEKLKAGESVEELEQQRRQMLENIEREGRADPQENLREIDEQIAKALEEGRPVEQLEEQRRLIFDNNGGNGNDPFSELRKIDDQIAQELRNGNDRAVEELEKQRKDLESKLLNK